VLCVVLVLVFLTAGPAGANEQRRNTPSFGVQYGYGALNGTGEFQWENDNPEVKPDPNRHQDFRYGGVLGLHIRYSLDQTHAVGVSFDDLRYGRKSFPDLSAVKLAKIAKQLQANGVLINYYLYFDRRARTTPYLLLGGGFHRDTFRFAKSDNQSMPIGPCVNLGIGVEYFVRPAWTIDATMRGVWLGARGGGQWRFQGAAPVAASLQLGFQHYLIK
jgi:opacity protein-like surface antigen